MRFASASGDLNPMHVDALYARRTQAGAPVVHGIHLLLWALDSLVSAAPSLPALKSLHANFNKFVYLDEPAEAVLAEYGPSGARLHVAIDGDTRSRFNLAFGDSQDCSALADALQPVAISKTARNLSFEEMANLAGRLPFQLKPEEGEKYFPAAARWLGSSRIAALAATSYLVGMVCPGLHSIYTDLSLTTCRESEPQDFLDFQVTHSDSRFCLLEQQIAGGGWTGTIRSIARIPPVDQTTMASLAAS